MVLSFRWYGPPDPVSLANIRQIPGMSGIVTSLYHLAPGVAWSGGEVQRLADTVAESGLHISVIESIPVHEGIKLGHRERDRHIDAFCASLVAVGEAGIGVVCYNFMPIFDWVRTDLAHRLPDGSTTLSYSHAMNPELELALGTRGLPGWSTAYSPDELAMLRAAYRDVDHERLWENLACFLERAVPAAEEAGVRLAIHPDDPPWDVFGIPRIITDGPALTRVTELVESPFNGVTLCTGSLAPLPENDLPGIIRQLGARGKIHFAHCRNIRRTGPHSFDEMSHRSEEGDVDMYAVLRAFYETNYRGPLRPDHGRMIWNEEGRPGYGLFDRALGAVYLNGLWSAVTRSAVH
jgi:mannonate dehydratase